MLSPWSRFSQVHTSILLKHPRRSALAHSCACLSIYLSIYLFIYLSITRKKNRYYLSSAVYVCVGVYVCMCLCDYSHTVQPRTLKFFFKFEKTPFRYSPKEYEPKMESSRLKGVAVITKTHTYRYTHILPNLGNT